MANSKRLAEVRNLLQAVQVELELKGATSTPKIIEAMREKHPLVLRGAASDIEEIGLARMVHQVSRRTRSVKSDAQGDFFKEHPGIPVSITIPGTEDDRGRRLKKLFMKSTRIDIEAWLSDDAPRHRKKRIRASGVTEFMGEIEPYFSSDKCTVEEALQFRAKKIGEG